MENLHGFGTGISPSGEVRNGNWENGKQTGKFEYIYLNKKDDTTATWEGMFKAKEEGIAPEV